MKHPEYDSPFEFVIYDIATKMVNNIDEVSWEAVQTVGINLDKEKLLIALKQDAERYREAFYRGEETGYTKRDEEIIRCKDCTNWINDGIIKSCKRHLGFGYFENWFCADGERRTDDA